MKISRMLISVFLLTFFCGLISFYLISNENERVKPVADISHVTTGFSQLETKIQNNVFDIEKFVKETEVKYNTNFLEIGSLTNFKDIKAKSGETWVGLFNENGKDVLRPTKIKVKTTKEENFTWRDVSVSDKKNPIFLLKNKKKFTAGKVDTLLRNKTFNETNDYDTSSQIEKGFNKKFYLNDVEYTLRVEEAVSTDQEPLLILKLETATTSQIIHFIYYADKGSFLGNLYWVGDLDRDGKLDLYMEFYGYEKGYYSSGLFLSSEAEKGKLVKSLEYFMLSTC